MMVYSNGQVAMDDSAIADSPPPSMAGPSSSTRMMGVDEAFRDFDVDSFDWKAFEGTYKGQSSSTLPQSDMTDLLRPCFDHSAAACSKDRPGETNDKQFEALSVRTHRPPSSDPAYQEDMGS